MPARIHADSDPGLKPNIDRARFPKSALPSRRKKQRRLTGMLEAGGGKIINIASQAASIGLDQHPAYCASKAGVRGPAPGGRGASRWVLPDGQRGLSAAAPGARRPHRGHRRLAACPETWPLCRWLSAAARGRARCVVARAWRRPASAAGARTVSEPVPAAGSGRDTVHGPAPDDCPAPPPGPPGGGMMPAQASPALSPPWPGSDGLLRASPGLSAWPGGTGAGGLPVPPAGSR